MTTIPFIAAEISGVALQTYDNSAVPKSYIDTISGNLDTKIDAMPGSRPVGWTALTAGTGFLDFEGAINVSGATPVSLDIAGYSTISSNAKKAKASGALAHGKVTLAGTPDYLTISEQVITRNKLDLNTDTNFTEGTGIGLATNTVSVLGYSTISSQAKKGYLSGQTGGAWYAASAQKLSRGYASSMAVKSAGYRNANSGWANLANAGTIAHLLGVRPLAHYVEPSGLVTFAIATKVDATNITVYMSAPGNRDVHWRAEA